MSKKSFENDIERNIKNNNPILIYGSVGTGKTNLAREIGGKLHLPIIVYNASLDELESLIRNANSDCRSLIIIDEAHDVKNWSKVERALESRKNPIIFATHDLDAIPASIKSKVIIYDIERVESSSKGPEREKAEAVKAVAVLERIVEEWKESSPEQFYRWLGKYLIDEGYMSEKGN
jgi:replication-associated recombination protein RarA